MARTKTELIGAAIDVVEFLQAHPAKLSVEEATVVVLLLAKTGMQNLENLNIEIQ